MSSNKCLACWEEIDDGQKICHHCGSDQEDVKDFLALAVLKQQKQKISVPEKTPVLDYIFKVDPETKEEVTITGVPPTSPTSYAVGHRRTRIRAREIRNRMRS